MWGINYIVNSMFEKITEKFSKQNRKIRLEKTMKEQSLEVIISK